MRVLLINNAPPNSGIGAYAFSLFTIFQKNKNISMDMAYTFDTPINTKRLNGKVIFLSKISSPTINRILNFFINPLRIPKKYDAYHIATQTLGRFARFIHPSIITVHDISPFRRSLTEPTRYGESTILPYRLISAAFHTFVRESIKSVKNADLIVTPSHFTKKELISALKINPQKIRVIPYGLRHELFKTRDKNMARQKFGLPLHKKIILHVGTEEPRKNIPTLIEAFNILQKRASFKVFLVRVGETRRSTKTLIEAHHLSDSVLQIGLLPQRELAYLYNAADMLVFPSLYEGFGMPPIEAMASGCPVIAGNRTSLPEVIGDAGILIDPLDADSIADEMENLLENNELRQDLRERGLRRVSRFSWEKAAEETIKIYKESIIKYV